MTQRIAKIILAGIIGAIALLAGRGEIARFGATTGYLNTTECFKSKTEFLKLRKQFPILYKTATYAGKCSDGKGYLANVKIPIDGIHEKDYLHSNFTITAN